VKAQRVARWLLGLVTHDVGRKALALIFALVLFEVLDKQVQTDDTLSIPIRYIDESDLDAEKDKEAGSFLLVVERAGGGKPLIVANSDKPRSATLQIRAARDSIERAKAHRHLFVWRIGKEGPLTPAAEDLEGTEALLQELGPGARVELDRQRFNVEAEEALDLTLEPGDVDFVGPLAPGYDQKSPRVTFKPREVRLVGPHNAIEAVKLRRAEIFEKFTLEGRSPSSTQPLKLAKEWSRSLRLLDSKGGELDAVTVSADFARKMIALPGADGRFELPVQVLFDEDRLRQGGDGKSARDGWRLELAKAVNGELRVGLQIYVPDTQVSGAGVDKLKVELAKQSVELVVRAHEAIVDRTTLPVHIVRFKDFPDGLDVAFADGQRDVQVEVSWKRPEGAPRGPDDKEKKGGGNDP
jgi:hypothetical protein